jgi:hypothetical protein
MSRTIKVQVKIEGYVVIYDPDIPVDEVVNEVEYSVPMMLGNTMRDARVEVVGPVIVDEGEE